MADPRQSTAGVGGASHVDRDPEPAESFGEPGEFDRDTALRRLAEHAAHERTGRARYLAQIAPGWSINGRPHGGYLAALLLRALVETVAQPERAPRTLAIHFLRPPRPGAARIETTTERAGASLSTLSARMEQDGETIALVLAAFSLSRASLEVAELEMPPVSAPDPARETAPELRERIERGLAPPFLRKLIQQPCGGSRPFSGGSGELLSQTWLGLAERSRPLDALALALLADAHFPTPFVRLREPAGAPTIDLTVHFRESAARLAARDPAELCLAQFRSGLIHEGFFEEDGVIWAADGTVLAQSRQLALLIAPPGG